MTEIFLAFFRVSLSASLVVLVLLLFSSLLNRLYASKWTYWIWLFLAFRLILPFGGSVITDQSPQSDTSGVPGSELFGFGSEHGFGFDFGFGSEHDSESDSRLNAESGSRSATQKMSTDIHNGQTAPRMQIILKIPAQLTSPIPIGFPGSNISITWLDVIAFIWMLGSVVFLGVHLFSYLHYKRQITKAGIRIRNPEMLRRIEELKRGLGIKSSISAVAFPEAASPQLTGFLKPILVLPEEPYTAEELYFILKHELVHCKRKDVYAKLLLLTANAIHWFNPLIWMMQKRAAVDMELSCDERVTLGADYAMRKAYTETLLSTLHRNAAKRSALSTQFYGGAEIMKKRFQNILNRGGRKNGAVIFAAAALLTIGMGTLIGCSVSHAYAGSMPEGMGEGGVPAMPEGTEAGDIPAQGKLYGYISEFNGETVTIDRQFWVTDEDEGWMPEYNDAAGFEVVDAQEGDITYPLSEDCAYSILENHHTPVVALDKKEFESRLAEMEYPVLWILQVQDGKVTDISEQYVP